MSATFQVLKNESFFLSLSKYHSHAIIYQLYNLDIFVYIVYAMTSYWRRDKQEKAPKLRVISRKAFEFPRNRNSQSNAVAFFQHNGAYMIYATMIPLNWVLNMMKSNCISSGNKQCKKNASERERGGKTAQSISTTTHLFFCDDCFLFHCFAVRVCVWVCVR